MSNLLQILNLFGPKIALIEFISKLSRKLSDKLNTEKNTRKVKWSKNKQSSLLKRRFKKVKNNITGKASFYRLQVMMKVEREVFNSHEKNLRYSYRIEERKKKTDRQTVSLTTRIQT